MDIYYLFIHLIGWRKDVKNGNFKGLYDLMVNKNDIIHLDIHDSSDGLKIFNCGTRYDYYLLKKSNTKNYKTTIKNQKNIVEKVILKNKKICPNYKIDFILNKLIPIKESDTLNVIRTCNYHSSTMKKKVY